MLHQLEAHYLLPPVDPLVHLAELDVADDVVDGGQARARHLRGGIAGAFEARPVGALVALALHEAEQDVAVELDAGTAGAAGGVLAEARLFDRGRPSPDRLGESRLHVGDPQGNPPHPVAVLVAEPRDRVLGAHAAGDEEGDLALPEDVAGEAAHAGLGPGVRNLLKAQGGAVEMGRLFGVADPEGDVVDGLDGHVVDLGLVAGRGLGHGATSVGAGAAVAPAAPSLDGIFQLLT